VADHVTERYDPRELALQIVDIISLRREIELCYIGISYKCFEVLEQRDVDRRPGSILTHATNPSFIQVEPEEDDDDQQDGDDDDDVEGDGELGNVVDPDETESESSDSLGDSDDDSEISDDERSELRVRLREILFYDDKVEIFKARHGKL